MKKLLMALFVAFSLVMVSGLLAGSQFEPFITVVNPVSVISTDDWVQVATLNIKTADIKFVTIEQMALSIESQNPGAVALQDIKICSRDKTLGQYNATPWGDVLIDKINYTIPGNSQDQLTLWLRCKGNGKITVVLQTVRFAVGEQKVTLALTDPTLVAEIMVNTTTTAIPVDPVVDAVDSVIAIPPTVGPEDYYFAKVPIVIRGIVRSAVKLRIEATVSIRLPELDQPFKNAGWLMSSKAEGDSLYVIAVGPKPVGQDGMNTSFITLWLEGAGDLTVQITGTVDATPVNYRTSFRLYRKGDVNEDGPIDSKDVLALLDHLLCEQAGKTSSLTQRQLRAANVNWDNVVDVMDAVGILQFIVGIISNFDQLSAMGAPSRLEGWTTTLQKLKEAGADEIIIGQIAKFGPCRCKTGATTWGNLKK